MRSPMKRSFGGALPLVLSWSLLLTAFRNAQHVDAAFLDEAESALRLATDAEFEVVANCIASLERLNLLTGRHCDESLLKSVATRLSTKPLLTLSVVTGLGSAFSRAGLKAEALQVILPVLEMVCMCCLPRKGMKGILQNEWGLRLEVPEVPSEPLRDDTERRRVSVRSMNGKKYDVTVCEDDCVGDIRKMLRHRTWSHVELSCDGHADPLKDWELVKSLPLGPLHMVIVRSQLVMACVGRDLLLWGCQCGTVETLASFDSAPTALLADVPSQRVLVGCHSGHLELLKITQFNQKWSSLEFKHEGRRGRVQAIQAFWEDDLAVVAFHNYNSELVIVDLQKGDCLRSLPQPEEVTQIAVGISGGRKICISACLTVGPVMSVISEISEDSEAFVLEPRRPRSQRSFSGTAIDVCFKQKRIVTGTTEGALELWSFSTGQIEHVKGVQPEENRADIRAIAADWSTERAVTASSNGVLRLWDLDHGCVLSQIQGHGKAKNSADSLVSCLVWCLSADFGEGGGLLCTSGLDRMVKLWRIKDEIELISQLPQTRKEANGDDWQRLSWIAFAWTLATSAALVSHAKYLGQRQNLEKGRLKQFNGNLDPALTT
eukprot:s53_g3.t1